MKKAFTLIELMVVIAILAILMGILINSMGGASDSARAAKCLSNMKNLAVAVQSYGAEKSCYPHAGSIEYMYIDKSQSSMKLMCNERKGWISWASEGKYPSEGKKGSPSIPMCTTDEQLGKFALTNGALWRYISGSKSIYVCPLHLKKQPNARWSYLMNAWFGWNAAENFAYSSRHTGYPYGELGGAERMLLFSEVPFQGAGDWFPDGAKASTDADAILQYKECSKSPNVSGKNASDGNEHIGANHKNGRNWFAHVVFADGHTEKFRASLSDGTPLGSDNLRKLTTWLCTGRSVSFNGKEYEELD